MSKQPHSENLIVGVLSEFESDRLPTNADVLKNYLYSRKDCVKSEPNAPYVQRTTDRVRSVWSRTAIPIINEGSTKRKVEKLFQDYVSLNKYQSKNNFNAKISEFRTRNESQLFDISVCKCNDKCKCSYEFKVPLKQRAFLSDQRTSRQMVLSPADQTNDAASEHSSLDSITVNIPKKRRKNDEVNRDERGDRRKRREEDKEKEERASLQIKPMTTKGMQLSNVVRERQRHSISSRGTASLINAFMKDCHTLNKENIIDRNKIIRQTTKHNALIAKSHIQNIKESIANIPYFGVFFDGKKDKTNVYEENESTKRKHLRVITEEHYAIVLQPNDQFYTHVSPEGSTAKSIAKAICDALDKLDDEDEEEFDFNKLMFIGSDGTNTNTGYKSGRI